MHNHVKRPRKFNGSIIGHSFVNFQQGTEIIIALTEIDHIQPPTIAMTYNVIGYLFGNDNILQRRSRAIDMRFHLVRDRFRQVQFLVYWVEGENNITGKFTKQYPTIHNFFKQSTYIVPTSDSSKYASYMVPNDLKGCDESIIYQGNRLWMYKVSPL